MEDNKNLHVTLAEGATTLTVLHGEALPLQEPLVINESGDIDTVAFFLLKRKDKSINNRQSCKEEDVIVIMDKENLSITLKVNPADYYGPVLTGRLQKTPELLQFKINEQYEFNREQLVKLIKFNKRFFTNAAKHDAVLHAYQGLQLKANTSLKDEKDNRGNTNFQYQKVIDKTNIPLGFTLEMPIYKGQPAVKFDVEICIESTEHNVKFWLESVELAQLLEEKRDAIFDAQEKMFTGFVIIKK